MNSNFQNEDDYPSKYKLIKLYAFIDNGYLLFSTNKNLHLMLRETPVFRSGRKGAQPTGCTSV